MRHSLRILSAFVAASWSIVAFAAEPFAFETVDSLDAMAKLIHQRFVLGTPRDDLRNVFVAQGQAKLTPNPTDPRTEKYLYDIDLCGYYVWRWNISADYDADLRLRQAWVNGEPVFGDGPQKALPPSDATGRRQAVVKGMRERPEAVKGDTSMSYLVLDPDVGSTASHAVFLTGTGPSRPDPVDFGATHVYTNVDPWRSIFDNDPADPLVAYQRNCRTVDATLKRMFTKPMGK
jgi:hypothetical protein